MKAISFLIQKYANKLERYSNYYKLREIHKRLGSFPQTAEFRLPDVCSCPEKIFLGENTSIYENSKFIISPYGNGGKFEMKRNSASAQGLTVITGIHNRAIGMWGEALAKSHEADSDVDIIVEEDVTLGANVTLLPGAHIGRGASIGAGAVCSSKIPPYAIAIGNPAQVVSFAFTPNEIIEHEKLLYGEEERLAIDKLEKNYKKYYTQHIRHIAEYMNLRLKPEDENEL